MNKYVKYPNTYRKANWALGATALGLVVAFPFQAQFWGGLATSGCSAGLVGGLADWFAVTALFRKPLGIRPGRVFRTEIIPRNRERIFEELTHMVQDELLSQEALTQKLAGLDFTALLGKLTDAQGLANLEPSLQALATCLLESMKSLEKESVLSKGQGKALNIAVSQILREAFKLSRVKGTVQKVLEVLAHELSFWTQSPEMHHIVQKWMDDALEAYVSENSSRKVVQMFLPDASTLATKIQMQVSNELAGGQALRTASEWLEEFVESPRFDDLIQQFLPKVLEKGGKSILQAGVSQPENAQKLTTFLIHSIEKYHLELEENAEKRVELNQKVQTLLSSVVVGLHDRIGRFVRDGLEKYSDEMLVSLIEEKAGDDLQMIRINGSVVGGMAGVLFYLVNFLL